MRVDAEEKLEGLDFGEHGMHAYDFAPFGKMAHNVVGGISGQFAATSSSPAE